MPAISFQRRGLLFVLEPRYAPGPHALTPGEAEFLDWERHRRIAKLIELAPPKATEHELRSLFEDVAARWTFDFKRRKRRPTADVALAEGIARSQGLEVSDPEVKLLIAEKLRQQEALAAEFLAELGE